jgi:hypothetical protein
MTPPQFAAFDEPGWGRIAAAFSLRHYGTSRTLISYEARTATGDPRVARRFALLDSGATVRPTHHAGHAAARRRNPQFVTEGLPRDPPLEGTRRQRGAGETHRPLGRQPRDFRPCSGTDAAPSVES